MGGPRPLSGSTRQHSTFGGPLGPSVRIGISSCLLGEPVRWDGGHKRDAFLTEDLAPFVEWVPICPEVELGMPVPREPVHIEAAGGRLRLVGVGSGRDHSGEMRGFIRGRLPELRALGLDGFVFKKGSPSCGLHRVAVHREDHAPKANGRGFFAAAVTRAWPQLPVEEEGRLRDAIVRESFIERVFAWQRLQSALGTRISRARLAGFHEDHELQLFAHGEKRLRALDQLIAGGASGRAAELRTRYVEGFMAALARPTTRASNGRALQRAAGRLKAHVSATAARELATEIDAYRRGLAPLLVPITLLRHHVRAHEVADLRTQTFLEPDPRELMLRNHV